MDSTKPKSPGGSSRLYLGVLWCACVFIAYHWFNVPYYAEKLSVFFRHVKGMLD